MGSEERSPANGRPTDAHLIELPVERHTVLQGNFLQVQRDSIRLPDGAPATREYVVHPGAVMVVPVLDDGRLVMERQFRFPIGQVILEFPAGKLDPQEAPQRCAERELAEETGYRAREWARACVIHNAPAYSTEAIEIWFARGLVLGERRLDAGEFLDVCLVTPAELEALASRAALPDVKSLAGLMWLQKWQAGLWSLDWQPALDASGT